MKILIIDDSKTVRKSLGVMLKNTNHTIYEAENGVEGFGKAFEIKPDLLFIDVMMPRFDGFQLCELIKKQEWSKDISICMLTGKETILDKAKIKNTGVENLIIKPFNAQQLDRFVKEVENKTSKNNILIFSNE